MKRVVRHTAGFALAALLALVLSACEGDPGPAGPPGTTQCFTCHSDDFSMANFILPIQQEYEVSQHALGDTYLRRTPPCSRCHTNEGFQNWVESGEEVEIVSSSKIQCFTCHAPHTNGDFSQRKMGPTEFEVEDIYTSMGIYDKGVSNTCASCHQGRPANPAIADGAVVTSSRWGPHHATQANVLSGNSAWVFPGASYAKGPSHELIENGCVHCHMAAPSGDDGGHTFRVEEGGDVNVNGCMECHDSWADDGDATDAVELVQDAFKTELNKIQDALFTAGYLRSNDPAEISQVEPQTFANADDLGAVYNYLFLAEDKSLSVHNPVYANDVLNATKAYLGIP